MVLAPDLDTPLPPLFAGALQIRAEVTNAEAIGQAVERALATRPVHGRPSTRPSTQPIGQLADRLLAQLTSAGTAPLLDVISAALKQAGLPLTPSSPPADGATRYALWVDELEAGFGNPLLLEVREGAPPATGSDVAEALRSSGVRTLLLLSGDAPERGALHLVEPDRQVLELRVADLVGRLRDHDLATALSAARLRAAGLDPAGA